MNLQSEVTFFSEMADCGQGRLMASFLSELTTRRARPTAPRSIRSTTVRACGSPTRLCNRISKLIEQYLGDDKARPADDVVLRMLLSPRADKVAEKMVHTAYRRALQNFERYDTTVFMSS